jgi:hypothetical protein
MARKTASRMDLRRMAEAAEARGGDAEEVAAKGKAKAKAVRKPAAKKTTRRTKEKAIPRRMMMWAVYNGNMKEEGRYPYAERKAAEEKIAQLREKSAKKLFFIQPIKVPLGDAAAPVAVRDDIDTDDEPKKAVVARDEEE